MKAIVTGEIALATVLTICAIALMSVVIYKLFMSNEGSTSVPGGWLVPLNYVKIGRPENEGEETAKVRLIVPHSQGTADASSSVTPYYYEITYQKEQ